MIIPPAINSTVSPILASPSSSPIALAVTPLNIFISLIPIILSCVLHPLGGSCCLPPTYSFLLRISPITNLIDAIGLLCELSSAIHSRESISGVVASRYTATMDYRARTLLSAITIAQFLKLHSYTGLWFTFSVCAVYFYSWVVLELVLHASFVCRPAPYLPDKPTPHEGFGKALAWVILHLFLVAQPLATIYAGRVETDNSIAGWYWYLSVRLPFTMVGDGYNLSAAGIAADSQWNPVLGCLWVVVSILPATVWAVAWWFWAMAAVGGPVVAIPLGWGALREDRRARVRAVAVVLAGRFRNWEWAVGGVLVWVARWWCLCVFEPVGTAKEGWAAGWP